MKICILTIATNKYIEFIEPLYNSISENFLNGHEIECLLFTNLEVEECSDNVKVCQIEHENWPIPTLKRYHYFLKERDFILEHDYCFYLDADMRIVGKVGEEIFGDIVATQHPGWWHRDPKDFNYERRRSSTAYIPPGEGNMYYAGGFNGGKTDSYIKMSEKIVENVENDFKNDLIAIWHDESHLNKYLYENPPSLELTPSYCYPEAIMLNYPGWYVPFEPKILALEKNHSHYRS
jgi:histo-blood group ABO system transferase